MYQEEGLSLSREQWCNWVCNIPPCLAKGKHCLKCLWSLLLFFSMIFSFSAHIGKDKWYQMIPNAHTQVRSACMENMLCVLQLWTLSCTMYTYWRLTACMNTYCVLAAVWLFCFSYTVFIICMVVVLKGNNKIWAPWARPCTNY